MSVFDKKERGRAARTDSTKQPPDSQPLSSAERAGANAKADDSELSARRGPQHASSGERPTVPRGMQGSSQRSADDANPPNANDEARATSNDTTGDERRRRIAEAAYYRSQKRGFEPGQEETDWLEAEKEIDRGNSV